MDAAVFDQVYEAFGGFHAYFGPLFGRKESREHSRHYLQALLVETGERRNAENLSETVPVSARAMQRFLTESPWDDEAVMGRLQEYLSLRLEHPEAIWVLDGSDFPSRAGGRWEWPASTAGGWGRWPTARRGCFWPTSVLWAGPWWTKGYICPRAGPRTRTVVRLRVCRQTGAGTGRRRSWPWRWWSEPWKEAI